MGWFSAKRDVGLEEARAALAAVPDPESKEDVISSGRVEGLQVEKGIVRFVLNAPGEHAAILRQRCEAAVRALSGVSDVRIVMTAPKREVPASPRHASQWDSAPIPHVGKIIAVASGKGGVGKSTTVVNLAHAMRRAGRRAGIVDADIYGPSIPRMLGASGTPQIEDGKMLPVLAHGIPCLSMGHLIAEDAAVVWRGPMLAKTLRQLLRGVMWGTADNPLDVLLIDMPPGTGDIVLSLAQTVPLSGVVIVTTPQDIAVLDARKALVAFKRLQVPVLGVVENMSAYLDPAGRRIPLFGEGGGRKLAVEQDVPFLGEVPLLMNVREAGDKGEETADVQAVSAYDRVTAQIFA
ncbi:MAG: Mrp/NBP35 family ATP-binding protein [Alphaproteobacteria bacterium]|nr:Mrp/NBP35 family ATP-binding protein [Alphaproteobacteria bacterium]